MNTPETDKERHRRSQYKAVWTALSDTHDRAKIHVTGTAEEAQLLASGAASLRALQETIGIRPHDIVPREAIRQRFDLMTRDRSES